MLHSSVRRRIDSLPVEILEIILGFSNGPSSLYSFVRADGRAKELFITRPLVILRRSIEYSHIETQLQQMLSTIISIRQRKNIALDDTLQTFVHSRLDDQSSAIDLNISIAPWSNPMELLKDTAKICDDLTRAEKSLLEVQLAKMSERAQDGITQAQQNREIRFPTQLEEHCVSPTELFRVRRAFWRLRLYFEAFYEPYLPSSRDLQNIDTHINRTKFSGIWETAHRK